MPIHTITADNLKITTHDNAIVVLYVWAEWCEPCVQFAPIFERCAHKHEDVFFGKFNAESRGTLLQDLQIKSIPALMVFRGNVMLYRQVGSLSADQLNKLITAVKQFDRPGDGGAASGGGVLEDLGQTWADWLRSVMLNHRLPQAI